VQTAFLVLFSTSAGARVVSPRLPFLS
jgi:hypothetical protein